MKTVHNLNFLWVLFICNWAFPAHMLLRQCFDFFTPSSIYTYIVMWRIKRHVLKHWTQISNNFSKILKIEQEVKKAVKFGQNLKSTVFRLPVKQYSTSFKTQLQGIPNLNSVYSRNIQLGKKTVLKSPGPGLSNAQRNRILWSLCLS